jgi:hypothetical protein
MHPARGKLSKPKLARTQTRRQLCARASHNEKSPYPSYLNKLNHLPQTPVFSSQSSAREDRSPATYRLRRPADTPTRLSRPPTRFPLASNCLIPLKALLPKRVCAESDKEHPTKLDHQTLPKFGSVYLPHKNRYRKIKLIGKRREL